MVPLAAIGEKGVRVFQGLSEVFEGSNYFRHIIIGYMKMNHDSTRVRPDIKHVNPRSGQRIHHLGCRYFGSKVDHVCFNG
jgi:hypothetical protein